MLQQELKDKFVRQGRWHYAHKYQHFCQINPEADEILRSLFMPTRMHNDFANMAFEDMLLQTPSLSERLVTTVAEGVPRLQAMFWANDDYPMIFDTGASTSLSPNKADFETFEEIHHEQQIEGIAGGVIPKGKGTIRWDIRDSNGKERTITTEGYYVPNAKVRLFSAYPYFKAWRKENPRPITRKIRDFLYCIMPPWAMGLRRKVLEKVAELFP